MKHWTLMSTAEKTAAILVLDGQGKIRSEIAVELSVTSGTLAGFCWREKVRLIGSERLRRRAPPMIPADDVPPETWAPVHGAIALEHNTGCCWPVDGGQCGAKKHRRSYCATHFAMAYRRSLQPIVKAHLDYLVALDERSANRGGAAAADEPIDGKRMALILESE